jgi:hypothetical protein
MPGTRSKRCRQARPLTAVGRLEERERPGLWKQFINAGPGRSRRVALTHCCQRRHRPRPWLLVPSKGKMSCVCRHEIDLFAKVQFERNDACTPERLDF